MENKKKMYRHLVVIYIMYFAALLLGFATNFISVFSRGWQEGFEQSPSTHREYIVSVPIEKNPQAIHIEGLPEEVTPSIERLMMEVSVAEPFTANNAFKVIANSSYAYLCVALTGIASIVIFVLFALIINSMRKSIRDEKPIHHRNIIRTRWIGGLFLAIEFFNTSFQVLHNREAAHLLANTSLQVVDQFPINYWNIIVGLLFIFMAEVFSIGSQLSEEQKLTI